MGTAYSSVGTAHSEDTQKSATRVTQPATEASGADDRQQQDSKDRHEPPVRNR